MLKYLVVLLLLPCCVLAQPSMVRDTTNYIDYSNQTDIIDVARSLFDYKPRKIEPEEDKDVYFSFLPFSTAVPGGGKALLTSTTAGFYLGDRKTTYISSITFTPYVNFKGRYGLPIRSNIWLKNNEWALQGDIRVMRYPQYTWGIGGGMSNDTRVLLDYKYVRIYQNALKRIKPYFFAGVGYNLDYYINVEGKDKPLPDFSDYDYGTTNSGNSFSSGASINLLYDTRNNSINPLPGCYSNLIYRFHSRVFGSNQHWQSLYFDMRKYVSLSKGDRKNVLALWGYYWTTLTNRTPYLNLPSVGWDPYNRSARGVPQNRYRGDGLIYFETEYRRDITRNGLLGYVAFASVNSVTEPNTRQYRYWHPAAGAGLRVKFNKKSGTNIGVDYGFSKGYSAVMLNLGEAF
ncbi:MAG: hypothetical protein EOO45_01490 [Flavobacterium sp.]|nr:MAG: hypothetical protein EOO45_01490 [Flavobacterium sp.]